ncbi:MAG: transposase [Christensenellaceae bacterium]|jgi:transposase|nr:transposase [Christensenellaceae bacterium]
MDDNKRKHRYKTGADRRASTFLPPCIDDYIDDDSIMRLVSSFVEELDLEKLGFANAQPKRMECSQYNPKDLLKLYIYGYLKRVTSSRSLEREAKFNLEAKWLMRNLTPDDRTIFSFRKENADALKKTIVCFSELMVSLKMCERKEIIIDGSKLRSNCESKYSLSEKIADKKLETINKRIEKFMKECDETDREEDEEPYLAYTEKIDSLYLKKQLQKMIKEYAQEHGTTDNTGKKEDNLIDTDARLIKQEHTTNIDTNYNAQAVIDTKNGIITNFEVTNKENDIGTLGNDN